MKATVMVQKEIDIKYLYISVPVRYDDEDIPYDFPLRNGDNWSATVEVDTGKITEWPKGKTGSMFMKVVDGGTYILRDESKNEVARIDEDYVPNSLIPGEYGDYIHLEIDENGVITNWLKNPSVDDFFTED